MTPWMGDIHSQGQLMNESRLYIFVEMLLKMWYGKSVNFKIIKDMKQLVSFIISVVFGIVIYVTVPQAPRNTSVVGQATIVSVELSTIKKQVFENNILVDEDSEMRIKSINAVFQDFETPFVLYPYSEDETFAEEESVCVVVNKNMPSDGLFAIKGEYRLMCQPPLFWGIFATLVLGLTLAAILSIRWKSVWKFIKNHYWPFVIIGGCALVIFLGMSYFK